MKALGGESFPIQVNHGYLGGNILPCYIRTRAIRRKQQMFLLFNSNNSLYISDTFLQKPRHVIILAKLSYVL